MNGNKIQQSSHQVPCSIQQHLTEVITPPHAHDVINTSPITQGCNHVWETVVNIQLVSTTMHHICISCTAMMSAFLHYRVKPKKPHSICSQYVEWFKLLTECDNSKVLFPGLCRNPLAKSGFVSLQVNFSSTHFILYHLHFKLYTKCLKTPQLGLNGYNPCDQYPLALWIIECCIKAG